MAMFDARSILGALVQAGLSGSTRQRVESALRSGGQGGLGDIASGVLGQAQSSGSLKAGGLGALAGAMMGTREGGSPLRGAISGGLLAVLGKIAYDALQNRDQGQPAATGSAPAPGWTPAAPAISAPASASADDQSTAHLLLRAMLSAAKADGQIDATEMQRIMGKLDEAGADAESKNLLVEEMRGPPDIDALAREARTPELAAQVYAASLLAIDVDTDAERDYLQRLAGALRLDADTVRRLHFAVGAPS
jgi:uncharacterized membrane protein YebE (DUF533 family)